MIRSFALVVAMSLVVDASACSCITRTTLTEQFEDANFVFVGRVISVEDVASRKEPKAWPGVAVNFQLLDILKAKSPPPTKLIAGIGTGDCGVPIFPQLTYVFFAGPKGEIDICSGTRPYVRGNEELEHYLSEVKSLAGQKSSP